MPVALLSHAAIAMGASRMRANLEMRGRVFVFIVIVGPPWITGVA
jgi:hypothetical protein